MLICHPSVEEVKNVVHSLNGAGAPSPDGFGGFLFQSFWHIVGDDVYKSVYQIFLENWILPGMNSNMVSLIPKFPEAVRIEDFRPISLANFQFKIITKVMADRLSLIAPKVIFAHQRGFVKGREISECVCITS